MSNQRYTSEFRDVAVRQVIDKPLNALLRLDNKCQ